MDILWEGIHGTANLLSPASFETKIHSNYSLISTEIDLRLEMIKEPPPLECLLAKPHICCLQPKKGHFTV